MSYTTKTLYTLDYCPMGEEFFVEPADDQYDEYRAFYGEEQSGDQLAEPQSVEREAARAKLMSYAPELLRALDKLLEYPDSDPVRRHAEKVRAFASTAWISVPEEALDE